jgi:uncharacterized protein
VRVVWKFLVFLVLVVVVGSLGAPLLYHAGHKVAAWGWWTFPAEVPFARYFNRSMMLAAFFGIWPFLRWTGLRRWSDLGLEHNPQSRWDLAVGFCLGTIVLIGAGLLLIYFELFTWKDHWKAWFLVQALGTAWLVATLEECFFRGFLLSVFSKAMGHGWAIGVVSSFFATVHFLKIHGSMVFAGPIIWTSGFDLIPYAFRGFIENTSTWVGCLSLGLLGLILALSTLSLRSLHWAIGLHAGIIFSFKLFKGYASRSAQPDVWVAQPLYQGWTSVFLMLLLGGSSFIALRLRLGTKRTINGDGNGDAKIR